MSSDVRVVPDHDASSQLSKERSDATTASVQQCLPPPPLLPTFRSSQRCTPSTFQPPTHKRATVAFCDFNLKGAASQADNQAGRPTTRLQAECSRQQPKQPERMVFYGWWREGHGEKWDTVKQLSFEFDANTGAAFVDTDGLRMPVDARTTHRPVELWDLHVGAVVNILGRRFELRRADLATQLWLDHQAASILNHKMMIEDELRKFCHLSTAKESGCTVPASKRQLEVGGRACLRTLGSDIDVLLSKLRQYRKAAPGHLQQSTTAMTAPLASGPDIWNQASPGNLGGFCVESGALLSAIGPEGGKTNYYEWLKTIPLAATAAGISPSPDPGVVALAGYATAQRSIKLTDTNTDATDRVKAAHAVEQFLEGQ